MMKRFLIFAGLAVVLFFAYLFFNAVMLTPQPQTPLSPIPMKGFHEEEAIQRFSRALQFPTISYEPPGHMDSTVFAQFVAFLQTHYPTVFSKLPWQAINQYSLLIEWPGRAPQLPPVVLMAHYDVVPVDSASLQKWTFDPFSGQVTADYILGRGALDDKVNVIAILEAVEFLLEHKFQPQRTIYIAFGHDEEIGGKYGARVMAGILKKRHTNFYLVLDEGGAVVQGVIPNIKPAMALIGIAEKGYVTLSLRTQAVGGHSSMPPPHTAIGQLAAGITRLENHPFPARITPPVKGFLEAAAPYMPFSAKLFIANLSVLSPLLKRALLKSPTTAAMLRTTTAVTLIRGGVKDNVLPTGAQAQVNFRILPGETSESVLAYVRQVVADTGIHVEKAPGETIEPSGVSSTDTPAFQQLQQIIRSIYPHAIPAPYLVMGATDSRYYADASDRVYRFSPIFMEKSDLKRYHGIDERVQKSSFVKAIQFYYQLLRSVKSDTEEAP